MIDEEKKAMLKELLYTKLVKEYVNKPINLRSMCDFIVDALEIIQRHSA